MNDFCCANPDDMNYKLLADRARYFKEDEKGVAAMCRAIEEDIKDAVKEVAVKMLKKNVLSIQDIAEYCNLTEDEVKELAESTKACMA